MSGYQDPLIQSEITLLTASAVCAASVIAIWIKGNKSFLDPIFLFRATAELILIAHITIEVQSSVNPNVCFPYLRLSDNLCLTSALLARCFYACRSSLCLEQKEKRAQLKKWLIFLIVVLYIKSLILINVLGVDESAEEDPSGCDFVYPYALPVYIAFENWIFDLIVVLFTARTLWKRSFIKEHTKNILKSICLSNLIVFISFIILISASDTYGIVDQNELIIVVFNLVYVTSIWLPDLFLLAFQGCKIENPKQLSPEDEKQNVSQLEQESIIPSDITVNVK